ncbi:MAG TPA: SIS domain-containing protein [Burkholderiales bacterium]|jgi:D-sedoheptulose 7-phosphate isomerase|nr:SIS domain-containing protein [Burkholderiales bacterium]
MSNIIINDILNSLTDAQRALDQLINDTDSIESIYRAAQLLIKTFEQGGKVISCGNGGSMCDAMHFAEELTGQYRKPRKGLPAIAIADPGHLTCVGNDYGYVEVFSRYLDAHGKNGDCLLAISTSGTSKNVLQAVAKAKELGVLVIGLSGKRDSLLTKLADVSICTPAGAFADRVQELHIKIIHILIEMVERHFFPENYSSL